ncbi:hypothetical protein CN213_06105 [Sinorhizobium meliloti]|uniref:hypothetical protein n=1 Tax=Rhizobium meliloti TaxID=382 RepID=UPI000FD843B9|nr:hypothetical protein [Sinorhizobium meliloti]RVH60076.1 hypothetical protein CN213_06105 [Sinorhizobium meliloti]
MAAKDNMPSQDVAGPVLYYVYEPFTAPSGAEIPAYTVYCDGEPIAFTDESLPREVQEHAAQAFLAVHLMLTTIGRITAEGALNHVHPGVRGDRL